MPEQPQAILCPYCGDTQPTDAERCGTCGGFFDVLSRRISQQHMGPWFIRDSRMPFRPGCSFEVILKQIQRGKITRDTVLRGPTTKQFWALARHVPGVAHHLGYCHSCEAMVTRDDTRCPQCGAAFIDPNQRDVLGIDPRDPNVDKEVSRAQAALAAEVGQRTKGNGPEETSSRRDKSDALSAERSPSRAVSAFEALGSEPRKSQPSVAKATVISTTSLSGSFDGGEPRASAGSSEPRTAAAAAPEAPQPPSQTGDPTDWLGGTRKADSFQSTAATPPPTTAPATAPVPQRSGMSPMVWALIALNTVLAIAAIGVIVFQSQADDESPRPVPTSTAGIDTTAPAPAPAPSPEPAPAPVADAPAPAPESPTPSPAATSPSQQAPPPSRPARPAPSGAQLPPRAPSSAPTPPASRTPQPRPATPAPTTNPADDKVTFFGIETPAFTGDARTDQIVLSLEQRMSEAQRDYQAGRLEDALAKLKEIRDNLPPQVQAEGLDESIRQIERELKQRSQN